MEQNINTKEQKTAKTAIKLSDHFSYKKIFRFTLPSIAMMLFSSVYGIVDGFFVSNFVGKTAFAAVNFIMPVLMIISTFGFMLGTGGRALVGKTLGEKDTEKANSLFSLFVYIAAALGVVISVFAIIFMPNIALALGAKGKMFELSVIYGRIISAALPAYMLQLEFQSFFVTAEKPHLGFYTTLASGLTNMVLDALFMAVFKMGVAGAAVATAISQTVAALIPIVYFLKENKSLLKLGKTKWNGKAVLKAASNGSSELMSNISMSLVGMLYNVQLLKYAGENGVSAYGVLMYVNMIFIAVFIGYAVGSAPIFSYNFGSANHKELKSLLKKSLTIIGVSSVLMFISAEIFKGVLSGIFVGYEKELYNLTVRAFLIFGFSFIFSGLSIFASSFFTALNDGLTSALISFLRTLVFQLSAILILPLIWGIDGIWASVVVADAISFAVSILFLAVKRKKYKY